MPLKLVRMLRAKAFWKPLTKVAIVSTVFGSGYFAGKTIQRKESETPEHAINVIQNQDNLTWRLKYVSSGKYSSDGGRDGLWVTRFKPRFTGTMVFVVFKDKTSGQSYLLLTTQERVVNQQKIKVCEPPIGFFNGEYVSSVPHVVSEMAERSIEKSHGMGLKPVSQKEIYNQLMQQYNAGLIPKDDYNVDKNLQETAIREVREEAGLNVLELQDKGFTVSQKILGEIDNPNVYSSVRQIEIVGDVLPQLKKINNDEVSHNEWVLISDIDLQKKVVKTSKGEFPLKSYDDVVKYTTEIILNISQTQLQAVNEPFAINNPLVFLARSGKPTSLNFSSPESGPRIRKPP